MKPREALNVFYENFELWKAHNYIDTQEDENIREAYTVLEELVNEKEKVKDDKRDWYRLC